MISRIIEWWTVNIPPWVLIALVAHGVMMLTVAYLILLERKIASWVQDRIGPNRVGLGFGIIPISRIGNERPRPAAGRWTEIHRQGGLPAGGRGQNSLHHRAGPDDPGDHRQHRRLALGRNQADAAHRRLFPPSYDNPSPHAVQQPTAQGRPDRSAIRFVSADRPIPVTYEYPFQIASLNIGVLYILAVLSLAVYGVVIGGWASNNKYSFLGGLRATANMISYEIPLGLAVLCIVVMYGTLDLNILVESSAITGSAFIPAWNVFAQPLAFIMFLICIHAEANRAPVRSRRGGAGTGRRISH